MKRIRKQSCATLQVFTIWECSQHWPKRLMIRWKNSPITSRHWIEFTMNTLNRRWRFSTTRQLTKIGTNMWGKCSETSWKNESRFVTFITIYSFINLSKFPFLSLQIFDTFPLEHAIWRGKGLPPPTHALGTWDKHRNRGPPFHNCWIPK